MALTDPVLTGPQDGRTITKGDGSRAELKVQGEQTGGQWAVVTGRVRQGDEGPIHTHARGRDRVCPRRRDHGVRQRSAVRTRSGFPRGTAKGPATRAQGAR
jgi:hypothetical protein